MDKKAMYKLSYGLFVLTARDGEKDNGCIINTERPCNDFSLEILQGIQNTHKRRYVWVFL